MRYYCGVSSVVRLASGLFSCSFTQSGLLCQTPCFSFTVAAFFQFLEVNGLYLMQVTLQDYCNVVLDYAEVELKKKTSRMSSSRVGLQQGCANYAPFETRFFCIHQNGVRGDGSVIL